MSMDQKGVGIHPAPEPSPTCVYALNEPDDNCSLLQVPNGVVVLSFMVKTNVFALQ